MKNLTLALLLTLACLVGEAQEPSKHTFEIKEGSFYYDGKPTAIYSGEMHFARIPKEYWAHRLKMLKAMGMNTVASYVFWNYHETAPGVWDFSSESRNIREFVLTAQREGLFVILRPGPYACAEWEFGGYPWWLQRNKELEIRTYNQPFLDSCRVYLTKLAEQVKDLEVSRGGPIIMVQVENEFGSYVAQRKDIPLEQHKRYNAAIGSMLKEVGFSGPFFTSDGSWLFDGGAIPGVLPTANGEDNIDNLKKVVNAHNGGQGPYMVAEFYPGWLDHWAEPFAKVPTADVVAQTQKYLENGIQFNFYMAHGGTNFAFNSGANYDKKSDIQPDITSYDYDAPISEAGWATEKYLAIRSLMGKHVSYAIPEIPAAIPVIRIDPIVLDRAESVLEWKNQLTPTTHSTPLSFEDLGQGHGYVIYSRKFNQPISGKLTVKGLRDYATVYVNGELVGVLNRQTQTYEMEVDIPFNATLDILVENMGRINYGAKIVDNSKGIIEPVLINGTPITGSWKMYGLPLSSVPTLSAKAKSGNNLPTFYSGNFTVKKAGDLFLDMRSWGKGVVFVNGHHLGRYWSVGPQQTLYVPGAWLKKGQNQIFVFEQLNSKGNQAIPTVDKPILDELNLPQ